MGHLLKIAAVSAKIWKNAKSRHGGAKRQPMMDETYAGLRQKQARRTEAGAISGSKNYTTFE